MRLSRVMDIFYKDVAELSSMLEKGELSSVELAKAVIERGLLYG